MAVSGTPFARAARPASRSRATTAGSPSASVCSRCAATSSAPAPSAARASAARRWPRWRSAGSVPSATACANRECANVSGRPGCSSRAPTSVCAPWATTAGSSPLTATTWRSSARPSSRATARATVAASGPASRSRRATNVATTAGASAAIVSAPARSASPPASATAASRAWTSSGLPPVTSWHAAVKDGSGAPGKRHRDQRLDPVPAQGRRAQDDGRLGLAQGVDQRRRGVHGGRLGAQHDRHPELGHPAREVGDRPQRGRVRDVRVVHDQQHRPGVGEVRGEPVEAVQGAAGVGVAVRVAGRGAARRGRGPGGDHGGGEAGGAGEQPGPAGHERLEQAADHAEREVALEAGGAGREDGHAEGGGALAGGVEQPGLADAGGALHPDQAAALRGRRAQDVGEHGQLVVALEDARTRPRRRARHGRLSVAVIGHRRPPWERR